MSLGSKSLTSEVLTSPNSEAAREFQNDGLLSPGRHLVGMGDGR